MNCDDCREMLIEYSLGQLESSRAEEVERHLKGGCAVCAERLAELTEAWKRLTMDLKPVTPSPAVESKLLAMIRGDVPPPVEAGSRGGIEGTSRSRIAGFVLAASLAGVVLGVVLWRSTPLGMFLATRSKVEPPATSWGTPSGDDSAAFQTVAFEGVTEKRGVHVSIVANNKTHEWHVVATGLPVLKEQEKFQLWAKSPEGEFSRLAEIPVKSKGRGGTVAVVENPKTVAELRLTVESNDSTTEPSDEMLFQAKVK